MAKKSWAYAQYEGLAAEMKANPKVCHYYEYAFPSAVSPDGVVLDLRKEFGDLRTSGLGWPIDEAWYVGAATGAAMNGMIPVVRLPSMTMLFNVDYVFNQLGKLRHMTGGQASNPVVIWQDMPGRTFGRAGGSAQQHSDVGQESVYANLPGVKIVIPSDAKLAKGLMIAAIRSGDPVLYFDYTEARAGEQPDVPDGQYVEEIGKAMVRKQGKDLTIVTYAPALMDVNKALPDIQKAGIDVEVIDLVTIKPYDEAAVLNSVKKTKKLLVVSHGYWTNDFSAQVISDVASALPGAIMKRITYPDAPEPFAAAMAAWMRPDAPKIVAAVKAVAALKPLI